VVDTVLDKPDVAFGLVFFQGTLRHGFPRYRASTLFVLDQDNMHGLSEMLVHKMQYVILSARDAAQKAQTSFPAQKISINLWDNDRVLLNEAPIERWVEERGITAELYDYISTRPSH